MIIILMTISVVNMATQEDGKRVWNKWLLDGCTGGYIAEILWFWWWGVLLVVVVVIGSLMVVVVRKVWLWWRGVSGGCEREEEMDFHARGHIAHQTG